MTNFTQADLAKFAAFLKLQEAAAQEVPFTEDQSPVARAAAKRREAMTINKAATDQAAANIAAASDPAQGSTLYAAREAAVTGYGAVVRYGITMNGVFGDGWPLLKKDDGGNAAATWEKVEQERRSFVALGKARGLANPAVHWANAKRHALIASGHAKRGAVEAKPIKARIVEDASRILVAAYRDGATHKQTANVTKAIELLEGAVKHLGGDLAALKAQAAKPLPGQPKGS